MGTIKRTFANNLTGAGKFDAADLTGTVAASNINNESLDNVTSLPASIGDLVEKVSSNPSPAPAGTLWYNTSANKFRTVVNLKAWSSGANLADGVAGSITGGFGTTSAAQIAGGLRPSYSTKSEQYDGTGWTIAPTLNTARSEIGGAGTQTAGLAFGGRTPPSNASNTSEEFDGSSFSEGNNLGTGMRNMGSLGTQTAALSVGGAEPSNSAKNQLYNGTSWSEEADLNTARQSIAGAGTTTAGIAIGGSPTNASETWDGTSWTTIPNLNSNRGNMGGFGNSANAIGFGGYFPPSPSKATTSTEEWDGTSWAVSPATLATGRYFAASTKNTTTDTGLATGGDGVAPGYAQLNTSEEYNNSINVITSAAWASGGAMTTARTGLASAGTQTANVFIGGQMSNSPYAPLNTVELYNGTSWSTNPNNAPYSASNNCGTGTQTAALSWGGYPNVSTTLEFDGSAFSSGGSLSTGRELTSSNIGTQTAAVAAGGFQRPGTYPAQSEEYNGSAWTAGGNLNTSGYGRSGAGTETAGLVSGGIEPGQLNATEEYDGTSFTSVNSRPYSAGNAGTSGTQTDALYYGGNPGGALTTTLAYDGTNWSTRPSMATARAMMGSSAGGTSTAALASSGAAPTATEEFTGETTAVNIVDVTDT